MITLAMFNALNVGFSAGNHIRYSSYGGDHLVFHVFSTVALAVSLSAFVAVLAVSKFTGSK